MKKLITTMIISAAMLLVLPAEAAYAINTPSAQRAILIHADTGEVLYEKNSSERSLIASTTKIMTAFVVLEQCSPDEVVTIKPEYAGIEGSSMYITAGQEYTVRELLYGMMLVSGNDAATALACHTSGSIENFAALMNEKAAELGLSDSSFKNPHGLDADGHYSTASDMAVITRVAMENEQFAEITGCKNINIGELTFTNHNKLLWRYDSCVGGKTGYTMAAGRSLVSCAERDGLRLICVTLTDPDDWNTHISLYNWAFENYSWEQVTLMQPEMPLPLISGVTDTVKVGCTESVGVLLPKGAKYVTKIELPSFVYAPVKQGDIFGALTVSVDGQIMGSTEISALETAVRDDQIRLTAWERFRLSWYRTNKLGIYYPGF